MDVYADTTTHTATSRPTRRLRRPASATGPPASPTTPRCSAWLERPAGAKRQPNLVFAAARWHGVPAPGPYAAPARPRCSATTGRSARRSSTGPPRPTRSAGWRPSSPPSRRSAGDGPLALLEVGRQRRALPLPRPLRLRAGRPPTASCAPATGPADLCRERPGAAARRAAASPGAAASTSTRSTSTTTTRWRWLDHPGLARARRPPGPAARRDRGRPDRPAAARARRPARGAPRRWSTRRRRTATVVVFHSAVIAYLRRRPGAVPRADGRAGRRRSLPLGQQRGPAGAARPGRTRPARGGTASCSASTVGRSPGPTATAASLRWLCSRRPLPSV